ncbi:hypothetical protein NZNM25_01480 [Nitrosopumilus zosterae]|uniref:HEPN AbiJ-N-terminal domain-containing protein n=1 Tax=Nitrosopumilus zosterae TaxID=718286 RepID=A0A2S2KP61_9ARCH|nr:hypothetical protein [Nitrosopumilus zosterae]BDQ31144.1 hypothetical protein NZOSNM25_001255 [Nitrosopumilus zosterae]GBH33357.1 hypothetical protein NZNM25_01480 [Nitrosopumilus zosterae]
MSKKPYFFEKDQKIKFQKNDLDSKTRIGLFNIFVRDVLEKYHFKYKTYGGMWSEKDDGFIAWKNFWIVFLEKSISDISVNHESVLDVLEEIFTNSEHKFLLSIFEYELRKDHLLEDQKDTLSDHVNNFLKKKNVGYRIVGDEISIITREEEIVSLNKSFNTPIDIVNTYMKKANKLLTQDNPDFDGSITNSIHAVESICKKITGESNTTLGQALKIIEKESKIELPTPLKQAFDKIYGWSSSNSGVRHGLSEIPKDKLDFEEAQFMLVACSAFVNYLIDESVKAKISLD